MKNLLKIGFTRLFRNIYFISGCILAVLITCIFLRECPIPQLQHYRSETVAIVLSGAVVLFFSVFVGLFIGNENEDGVLRSKVMAGHTQNEVYMSHYITLLTAMAVMMVCWFAGALAGGAKFGTEMLVYLAVALLYNAAYIAVVQALVFRIRKQVTGIVLTVGLFYLLVNCVLFGNLFYMITAENSFMNSVVVIVYNLSALGQCFARTDLSDPGLGETIIQIPVSLLVAGAALAAGTAGLKKRDIN